MTLSSRISDVDLKKGEPGLLEGGQTSTYRLVRDLRPGDALRVAGIHFAAFPETRSSLLGVDYLERYYCRHFDQSGTIHLGLDLNGRIMGFICGGPAGYQRLLSRRMAGTVARAVLWRPWVIFRLLYLTFHK